MHGHCIAPELSILLYYSMIAIFSQYYFGVTILPVPQVQANSPAC